MTDTAIDYDALAQQHGGTVAVDYDALAAQHGGTSVSAAPLPNAGLSGPAQPITPSSTVTDKVLGTLGQYPGTPTDTSYGVMPSTTAYGIRLGDKNAPPMASPQFQQSVTDQAVKGGQMAMGGGGIKNATEGAVALAGEVLPSAERAGQAFKKVSATVGKHTVPITDGLSNALMNYQGLVDTGGSRSLAVSKLLSRITSPDAAPLTYDEARQFYSNISRLSANESMRLTPQMKRAVGMIAQEFNGAISQTADDAGKLGQFQGAMKEYASAKNLEDKVELAKKYLIRGGIGALGGGLAGAGAKLGYDILQK